MAAYGAQIKRRQDAAGRARLRQQAAHQHVPVQDKSGARGAADLHSAATATCCSPTRTRRSTAQKKGEDVDYVIPDDTILIQNPIAATTATRRPQAQAFLDYAAVDAGAAALRRLGLPPGRRGRARGERATSSRRRRGLFTIDDLGGWNEGQRRVLRPRQRARSRRSRRTRGSRPPSERDRRSRPRRRRRVRGRRARPGARSGALGVGVATLWLSVIVLLPLAAVVGAVARRRRRRVLGRGLQPRRRSRRSSFTLVVSLVVAAINAVVGHADRLGARARRASPARRIVNALIDLPFALPTIVAGLTLLALYGPTQPGRHRRRLHAARRSLLALLFVTLPFVVRSVQPVLIELDREMEEAAASLGARAADDLPPRSCCRTSCRRSSRGAALGVRARGRRVRLGRADLGQHPVQDRRSRRSSSSSRSRATTPIGAAAVVGRAAGRLARSCCSAIRGLGALGGAP